MKTNKIHYQNADPNEIAKFSVSDSWWNINGSFKALHDINPIRMAFIQRHCQLQRQRVLDVGCGGGILAEALAHAGAEVTGLDLNNEAIAQATAHARLQDLSISYQQQTVEEFSQANANASFDIITCMELLEHVPNPPSIINACIKLAKPKSKLFFATINRNPKAFLAAIVGAEYLLHLLPKGTHQYAKFIRPSELSQWLRQAGAKVTTITGMTYHPLSKTYTLTNNVAVNYLLCAEKC